MSDNPADKGMLMYYPFYFDKVEGQGLKREVSVMGFLRNKILKIDSRKKGRTTICVLVEEPGRGQEYFDKTVDLSETGIFVETDAPRKKGEQVTISFALPGTKPITVTGRVAHIVKGRGRFSATHQPNGMGIEFTQVDPKSRKLIQDFVNA